MYFPYLVMPIIVNHRSKSNISLVSEQHHSTRSASAECPMQCSFRTNIKTFCPSVISRHFWNDLPLSSDKNIENNLNVLRATLLLLLIYANYIQKVRQAFTFFNWSNVDLLSLNKQITGERKSKFQTRKLAFHLYRFCPFLMLIPCLLLPY